jgi:hypothetical protein
MAAAFHQYFAAREATMNAPTDAERGIKAEDDDFFARHPGRLWRLRMPAVGESVEAVAVAVHHSGVRVCLAPAPDWSSDDTAIETALREGLPPAAWALIQAAIKQRQQS